MPGAGAGAEVNFHLVVSARAAMQVALKLPAAQERLAGLQQRADAERVKLKELHEELRKHDAGVKKAGAHAHLHYEPSPS